MTPAGPVAWYLLIGAMLIGMALIGSRVERLPLSTAILSMSLGVLAGPAGNGLLHVDLVRDADTLRTLCEAVLLISLFSAGLKLRVPLADARWRLALRLAGPAMLLTLVMLVPVLMLLWQLSLATALLLAAILAPTDPALASDVQVEAAGDRDRVRVALTGEASLNDGLAMPLVLLGLGLAGRYELGPWGMRWLLVDVAWAMLAGCALGGLLGLGLTRLVVYLRRRQEAVGLDECLALGLIAVSYGMAHLLHCNGFLAVFAAGVAMRRFEHRASGDRLPEQVVGAIHAGREDDVATHPDKAPAYVAHAVLGFNAQLERVAEMVIVFLIGNLLSAGHGALPAMWLVPLLFIVIRPLAAMLSLTRMPVAVVHRRLIAWFGIRGVGSLYYVLIAMQAGLPARTSAFLLGTVLTVVAASVVVHGVSATPLMRWYERRGD